MDTATTLEVDFHLTPDGEHTIAFLADLRGQSAVIGQRLIASDGDVCHWAIVDTIDETNGLLSLRILWDEEAPVS